MANTLSSIYSDYVQVHTLVGESGQGIEALIKNATGSNNIGTFFFFNYFVNCKGRAYKATLFEAEAISNLAKKAGKTYGINGLIFTHGETDSGNANYENQVAQLYKVFFFFF
jgi:hypothetical protein